MNSSATSHVQETCTPFECELFTFLGGRLDSSTTEAYVVLQFIAIMNLITCPITTDFERTSHVRCGNKATTENHVQLGTWLLSDHRWDDGSDRPTSFYRLDYKGPTRRSELRKKGTISIRCKDTRYGVTSSHGLDERGAVYSHKTLIRAHNRGKQILNTLFIRNHLDRSNNFNHTFKHYKL